ncbi:MAG: hypothetical protein DWQ07_03475 [Chloroflexi bacterium]|nr:MAG: hypothetical protein DWQ07_03475 [Chloroflexota bacterium]MBL1193438.1 hypothetical protein [Chloroflexota bacterium]NOH10729.1 hypothetical protein [Chloroflexota bacterium]
MGISRNDLYYAALALVMMSFACSVGSPAPATNIDQIPPPPSATQIPEATTPSPIDSAPAPITIPEAELTLNGPWLVFANETGIWAVNPDGSGLKQLTNQPIAGGQELIDGIPTFMGRQVAYITATGFDKDLTLHIVALPQGSEIFSTPLISEAVYAQGDGGFAPEPVKTAGSLKMTEWSRDGRFLAFMAALDGPTLDLYLYDILSGEVIRLTDGPSQAIRPSWSPTGDYIFHMGVDSIGTGAGMSMAGAWVSNLDGSEVRSLYDPRGSGDEVIVGWIDDLALVIHSWNALCGTHNLRTLDIQTGSQEALWQGYFEQVALDPFSGTTVVSVGPIQSDCNEDDRQGLFMVSRGIPARQIIDQEVKDVVWSPEAMKFFSRTELGTQAISLNGEWQAIAEIADNFPPIVSPEGELLAWFGTEKLWVGPLADSIENPPQKVFNEGVTHATWTPDGDALFIFSENRLWFAPAPQYIPSLVAEGISTFQSIWLSP